MMTLILRFGLKDPPIVLVWDKALTDFPNLINKDGKKWEWLSYDQVKYTISLTYELTYTEIPSYDPNYYAYAEDWLDIFNGKEAKCECGSDTVWHPGHDWFCRKFKKI